jgi:hypothetical protein
VAIDNLILSKSFGSSGPDVVLVQLLEHGSADHTGEDRRERETERNCGKDEVQEKAGRVAGACSGDWQPTESDREDQDQDGTKGKVGEGEPDQRDDTQGSILPAIAMEGRPDTGWNRERNTNEKSCQRQGKV